MTEPMRVLQVVTEMNRAGLETMLMNYYRHIDRKKIQFDFLVHREGSFDYDSEIIKLGGKIFQLPPISFLHFPKYLKKLKIFFKENDQYQIVHCHLDALSAFTLSVAKESGIPIRIAHSHNNNFTPDLKLPLRYIAKSLIKYYATHFWGCSEAALRFMFGDSIIEAQSTAVIPNAIDLKNFSYRQDQYKVMREILGVQDRLVIGHIGRFSYQKNQEFLLDVLSNVLKSDPSAILILIGDGENLDRIRCKVTKLKLDTAIRFLGVREDIPDLLNAMDIFVLPSRFEGFGMVLLEAQANGLPCIASDGVTPEVNVTGNISYLPLNQGPGVWANKILSTPLIHYDENHKLEAAGYNIKSAADALQNLYLCLWNETHQ